MRISKYSVDIKRTGKLYNFTILFSLKRNLLPRFIKTNYMGQSFWYDNISNYESNFIAFTFRFRQR